MDRVLSYPEAIREATEQEMARDPAVFVMGQGVDDPKRILGTTKGLLETFGAARVFDTPLSEDGMAGFAIGAALGGLRPVYVHIRMDFVLLAMNQLVNMAAKIHSMYGGALHAPLVVRAMIGKSWGQGPQHSQGLYPMFMHVPGLKIVAPTTPHDAKGCLIQAIRDDNPVVFVEHRHLYYQKGHVPPGDYAVPFGRARVLAAGSDVTLVGISQMAIEALRARRYLEGAGIRAEVIDPVSLCPLDIDTIEASVRRTRSLVVVDNSWMTCGAGAEIVACLAERGVPGEIRVRRMGFAFTTCPTAPTLEDLFYPDAKKIASAAHALLHPGAAPWVPDGTLRREEVEFKGPF